MCARHLEIYQNTNSNDIRVWVKCFSSSFYIVSLLKYIYAKCNVVLSADWILEQKKHINGKTCEISVKSVPWWIVMYQWRYLTSIIVPPLRKMLTLWKAEYISVLSLQFFSKYKIIFWNKKPLKYIYIYIWQDKRNNSDRQATLLYLLGPHNLACIKCFVFQMYLVLPSGL